MDLNPDKLLGVRRSGDKLAVYFHFRGKSYYLGTFENEEIEDAARLADAANVFCRRATGKDVRLEKLNLPDYWRPRIERHLDSDDPLAPIDSMLLSNSRFYEMLDGIRDQLKNYEPVEVNRDALAARYCARELAKFTAQLKKSIAQTEALIPRIDKLEAENFELKAAVRHFSTDIRDSENRLTSKDDSLEKIVSQIQHAFGELREDVSDLESRLAESK